MSNLKISKQDIHSVFHKSTQRYIYWGNKYLKSPFLEGRVHHLWADLFNRDANRAQTAGCPPRVIAPQLHYSIKPWKYPTRVTCEIGLSIAELCSIRLTAPVTRLEWTIHPRVMQKQGTQRRDVFINRLSNSFDYMTAGSTIPQYP